MGLPPLSGYSVIEPLHGIYLLARILDVCCSLLCRILGELLELVEHEQGSRPIPGSPSQVSGEDHLGRPIGLHPTHGYERGMIEFLQNTINLPVNHLLVLIDRRFIQCGQFALVNVHDTQDGLHIFPSSTVVLFSGARA
jgi:hypothetical protein